MPAFELENASLQDYGSQCTNGSSQSQFATSAGLRSSKSQDYVSSANDLRSVRSDPQSIAKSAFTNFTESLSHSSEELQHGVKKTFSSIVNSFSRDAGSSSREISSSSAHSESGSDTSGSDSSSTDHHSSLRKGINNNGGGGLEKIKSWSESFAFGDALKTGVSSLTSRSSSYNTTASSNESTLSSRSNSPRMMNAENIKITVNNSGFVLRESSDESSADSSGDTSNSSVASWQETASRDRSLLDTIGESSRDDEDENDEDDGSSSSSGSDNNSASTTSGDERVGVDAKGIHYDYDDDSTEFNSDVGLEDLGAVMMQIGSCQFDSESASQSFEEEYSYSSGMFPPVVTNYLAAKSAKSAKGDPRRGENDENEENDAYIYSEASKNSIFKKRIYSNRPPKLHHADEGKKNGGIASFLVSDSLVSLRPNYLILYCSWLTK
jgi:hypothetical protein